jgi:hypothetical protein
MKKEVPPPICYICDKNYENEIYNLYYCICDAAICEECINSVKNSDSTFICPKCSEQNNLKKSKLIRND